MSTPPPLKVLAVDDEDDVREGLTLFCRLEGCEVDAASNGFEAMALYWRAMTEGKPYGLILLDLAMPLMDGISVAKRIRSAEGDVEKLPRTYLHGYTGQGEYLKSEGTLERAGFDSVTIKPGEPAEISRLIERLRREVLGNVGES